MYAYYGSKEGLFDAVLTDQVEDILDAAPLTADDLPGYAVRLYDAYLAHPQPYAAPSLPDRAHGIRRGQDLRATPPAQATSGSSSQGLGSGRQCVTVTTPGSRSSRPSKNPLMSSGLRGVYGIAPLPWL